MRTQICSDNPCRTGISSLTCGYHTSTRPDNAPGFYRIAVPAWPGRVMICSPGTMSEQQALAFVPGGVVVERHRSSLLFPDDRARHAALPALRRRPAVPAVRRPALDSPAAHPASPAGPHRRARAVPQLPHAVPARGAVHADDRRRCRQPCPPGSLAAVTTMLRAGDQLSAPARAGRSTSSAGPALAGYDDASLTADLAAGAGSGA